MGLINNMGRVRTRRFTEADYKHLKTTYNTLKGAGHTASKIRQLLNLGHGTIQYISTSKNFTEYCEMRDEVIRKHNLKKSQSILKEQAIAAAKSIVEAPVAKRGRPRKTVQQALPILEAATEAPINIEKLVQANFEEFRAWFEKEYSPKLQSELLDKFKEECVNTISEPVASSVAGSQKESRRRWWAGGSSKEEV